MTGRKPSDDSESQVLPQGWADELADTPSGLGTYIEHGLHFPPEDHLFSRDSDNL